MALESDLAALLKTLCARVYPDVAPAGVAAPYVTYQGIGGESLRYGDNTAPDKRNTLMQIDVWSKSRTEALSMIRSIEAALCASPKFTAEPEGEPVSDYESDTELYGSIQRFSIWSDR